MRLVIPSVARDLLFLKWSVGLCVIMFLITFSARAQTPEPAPLAHGNVPGEPHHHLKIENEYIRAYYVEAPPHEATLLHQHNHDYLFVTLGDSDVMNEVPGKPEVHLMLKDGEVHFTRGGFAHVARNLSDKPFRNITIELLKSQGEAHNLCAQVILNEPLGRCDKPGPNDLAVEHEFETTECRVDMVQLRPKMILTLHTDKLTFLLVPLTNSRIRVNAKNSLKKTAAEGGMIWIHSKTGTQITNEDGKAAAFVQITFKDAARQEQ